MIISLPFKQKSFKFSDIVQLYREPIVTYCITPNNSPESRFRGNNPRKHQKMYQNDDFLYDFNEKQSNYDAFLNEIYGLFSKFYIPERVRFISNGIKVKLNDVVSYKIVYQNSIMKFFISVPERFSKSFLNAIRLDWGNVDITLVENEIIYFDYNRAKAIDIILKHHYALSIKHDKKSKEINELYPSLSGLGATLLPSDKLIIDFNINPVGEEWKNEAHKKYMDFKNGIIHRRVDKSPSSLIWSLFGFFNLMMTETMSMITDIMGAEKKDKEKDGQLFDLKYTVDKLNPNSKGYQVQIRAIAETEDVKRSKYLLKNVQSCFETLDGDNKFTVKHIRTKRGIKSVIKAVENNVPQPMKGKDIFFEKELSQLVRLPDKQTLREYKKIILQDNFTRTEILDDFYVADHDAIPFAKTLDKEPKVLHFPSYERNDWSNKGRKVHEKTKLDDRCTATLAFGRQGSGKTELIINQIVNTFGVGLEKSEWIKRSKSVVAFDVADGEIITKVWNLIPSWLRDRVNIINHSIPERPVQVNFADLEEFNRNIMHDPDYAFSLAELEASLISDVLETGNSILVNRWFTYALQCAHTASPDFGIPEAIRLLIDDEFRLTTILPNINHDEELMIHMETYNEMRVNGETSQIVTAIQNRLSQLSSDRKLWDCIAQVPLRDKDNKCAINFRKWMDGDENGAYLTLVYIPKEGVSQQFRKFLFAHYLLKIWKVAVSREKGFAGREYRPETLVVFDEIHQILGVPTIGNLFIDLFKEPRKYSVRLFFSLHGWSSLATAGRGIEHKIKQSILDNGANLIMLKGGRDAFESLENFMGDMSVDDYDNLMGMDFCGIFSIWWKGCHVFQGKLLPPASSAFKKYDNWDLYDLAKYESPFSRSRDEVRKANLSRIKSMLKKALREFNENVELADGVSWNDIEKENIRPDLPKKKRH